MEIFEAYIELCLKDLVNWEILGVFLYELITIDSIEFSSDMGLSYGDGSCGDRECGL